MHRTVAVPSRRGHDGDRRPVVLRVEAAVLAVVPASAAASLVAHAGAIIADAGAAAAPASAAATTTAPATRFITEAPCIPVSPRLRCRERRRKVRALRHWFNLEPVDRREGFRIRPASATMALMGARTVRLIAGLTVALAWPAPAVAFTPPELFVRPQLGGIDHAPAGDWVPLASTPDINYIGGFQIGYRLQSSGEPNELQRAALSFLAVPDGQPTQPTNTPPYCVTQIGTPGTIVPVGSEVQFEGDGPYTVQVSIGAGSGGATDHPVGPSTTGSFTVSVRVTPELVGDPLAFRRVDLAGNPFVGVHVDLPPGGFVETGCARDAKVQPDGSIADGRAIDGDFSEIRNSCSRARGAAWRAAGSRVRTTTSTPSATGRLGPHRYRSWCTATSAASAGSSPAGAPPAPAPHVLRRVPRGGDRGAATLKLRRFVRCKGRRFVAKKFGTHRGRFDYAAGSRSRSAARAGPATSSPADRRRHLAVPRSQPPRSRCSSRPIRAACSTSRPRRLPELLSLTWSRCP